MARIKLMGGFSLIPEGTHIFKITSVVYKESFGKVEITMQTKDGSKHIERFSFLKKSGDVNEGAMKAFSYFAKVALNNFTLDDIDPVELVGHFIECEVEHDVQPNINKPGETITFVRLGDKRSVDGFDGVEAASAPVPTTPTGKVDLKTLLG